MKHPVHPVDADMKVQVFSDVACPWCYIGKRRFERALAAFEQRERIEVEWRSYQLDPTVPEHDPRSEARYLAETKGMPEEQVRQMLAHVIEQAAGEGLDYDFDAAVVANSWKAHRLIQRAKAVSAEVTDAVEERLFSAHFERGQNIGEETQLTEIGASAGLTEQQVHEALTEPRWDERVRQDINDARGLGVTGVPFFVLDGKYGISGAQPTELFEQALRQAWTEHQPLRMVSPVGDHADGGAAEAQLNGPACGPDGCD